MRYLVIGDVHEEESCIAEIQEIFNQIVKSDIKVDKVVLLGDFYDKKKPSPAEIYAGTRILATLASRFNEIVLVSGNHDIIHDKLTTIDYARFVSAKITICDEYIADNVFFGHFFTDKSNGYGAKEGRKLEELNKYSWILLGHQHDFQEIKECVYHLGSIRYVSFGETASIRKRYAILDTDENTIVFRTIERAIPILDVYGVEHLDFIEPDTKVRVIYKDFTQFKKEVNLLSKYKEKFVDFKIKLDFARADTPDNKLAVTKESNKLANIVNEWLQTIVDEEVRDILDIEFTKEL